MNLKIKIDKYGNLVNLDTNTIVVASNELFTDNFWETDGTTWKVNTTTQVTASANDAMPTVVPIGEFTQNSRVDFYFRLHLPVLDYNKVVNIFEFGVSTSYGNDIRFHKPANYNVYCLYANGTKQDLPIASTESLDIVGVLTMYNIGSNTLAVFITLYSNENGTLTKLVENAYRGSSSNKLYFGVSRDYHTNLSSYMVEGIAFDEDIIINPSNNNVNPISAITKYLNGTGLSEVWTNTKNYISAQLLGYSQTGHTHSASDITSGLSTVATSGNYNDLSNKPTIPSKTSDLTNDSGFITEDNTKIPLAGSNAISGSLIPSTNGTVNLGSSSQAFLHGYFILLQTGDLKGDPTWGLDINYTMGANLILRGKNYPNDSGVFHLFADDSSNTCALHGYPNGTLIWTGNVIRPDSNITCTVGSSSYRFNEGYFGNVFCGGLFGNPDAGVDINYTIGANLILRGKNRPSETGIFWLVADNGSNSSRIMGSPDGTLTWNGQPIQYASDARLKQQITQIDDDLLTAWEDVNLVQFKYNDAVKEKSDNARLHTGYVVQQIDDACKSHGVDVSKYGLYCHEEYAEETREVEHDDGTKTTEVVRPASEHYSLRYTEALIVECAYLRKKLKELTARIEELEKGNNSK